jgi:DNA-directed RNA polymerase specialized sigma24 family protein
VSATDPHHATHRTIEAVWRIESARVIAGLTRLTRDVGLAEDLAQEALVAALEQWPQSGAPDNPGAWLTATAKRRTIDLFRRNAVAERKHGELARELEAREQTSPDLDSTLDSATQPGDELILNCVLETEDYADLRAYLKRQPMLETVSERGVALDHAFDPHRVVELVRHTHLNMKLTHTAMELGKATATSAGTAYVKGGVDKRNAAKQKAIEAKEGEPLLFDQYGHRLDIRPESKKRR